MYFLISVTVWRCCIYQTSSFYFMFNSFKVAFSLKFLLIHYLIHYKLLALAPKVKHTTSLSQDNRQYWPQKQKRAIQKHMQSVFMSWTGAELKIKRLVPVFKWLTLVWFVSSICLLVQGQTEPSRVPSWNSRYSNSLCTLDVLSTNLIFSKMHHASTK